MFTDYPDVLNVEQLCSMLNIGKNTAYKLINDGKLKSIRIGKKHKILKSSVVAYLEKASA